MFRHSTKATAVVFSPLLLHPLGSLVYGLQALPLRLV